ncbi:hypothetical protein [Flavobacterium sp. XGLA_31]|uniref:hypothetical protein n=1 Tax=Flavobacterium sp. XGLA_31 TaxID=3447666 RepID=UPI003F3BF2ED
MKKINVLITLFFAALLIGCSSSSGDSDGGGSTGQNITFKFNGVDVTASVTSAKLYKSQATDEKMLKIIAETTDKEFEWTFFSGYTADDAIPTGDYLSSDTVDDGYAYVSYKINGNKYGMHNPDSGTLHISACNSGAKTATGTFVQTMHAIGETDDFDFLGVSIPYEINLTNGVFTNIHYEVVNLN